MKLSAVEWARVERLYPHASELAGAERERFLAHECGREPRVRAELEAMLDASGAGDDLLSQPVGLGSAERMADLVPAGTRLGSWRIKGLIGHGGMGEVYLAERADGAYTMDAAIKLLRRELFSYANAQRFLRERRVLARLSHPNIARVLDAGTTDDGRPYLVMEYVRGARITDHARSRALPPREVARLLLAVAEAVAEVHRNHVVHRDLKPANVLVTAEGQVKLLDFGIARLPDESDDALGGHVPMSPPYAAPEQILGRPLTPASDVFALGVMLFQLLTHRLPHLREGLPLPVIAAGLRDETVERPSRVVLADSGAFDEPSRRRTAQALAGDLDWIVLKALQAAPERRYAGAGELADDLKRYLAHLPVYARQDSASYRASRFIRRYPTQVVAAGFAFMSLTLGLGAALWQARVAHTEAARAERVKEFVLSVFREQDPMARRHAIALTPAQIIATGLARADTQLRDDPALHAEVLDELGSVQAEIGDPAAGRATLERALTERRALGGNDLPQAETLLRITGALISEGKVAQAQARIAEAREILVRHDAEDSVTMARLELRQGFVDDLGKARGKPAAAHFEAAQKLLETLRGPDDPLTIGAIHDRGQALEQARIDDEALIVLREAIRRIERSAGPDSAQLIWPLAAVARVLKRSASYDEAVPVAERAIALARRHYGPVSLYAANELRSLADLEQSRGDYAKAETLFREAEVALPASALDVRAELLKDRGQFRLETGKLADAEADLAASFALFKQTFGEKNGFTWFVASQWGRALAARGRLAQAEEMQRDAAARLEAVMGPDAYQNRLIADDLAETLGLRGKWREAVALRRRALALTDKKYPPDHRLPALARVNLAHDLYALHAPAAEIGSLLDAAIPVLRGSRTDAAKLERAVALRDRIALQQKPAVP